MTDKSHHSKDNNIILYPGLVRRLLELGMESLKVKEGQSAYDYFKQAESIEPDNPKVRFGKMLSLVELGRLEEAVQLTDKLLKEGTGDYYENLQVHISLLVQLSRYEEVIEILDVVLAESQLPSQHAESLYKLLHFSRQMTEDEYLTDSYPIHLDSDESDMLELEDLQSDSPQKQWQSIQLLSTSNFQQAVPNLITYIEDSSKDLLLRSYALQLLMKWEVQQDIHISKLGQSKTVSPATLAKNEQMSNCSTKMKGILSQELEHENPILYEMATQLLIMHMLVLFPFYPKEEEMTTWAASFHLLACERLAMDCNEETIAMRYGCNVSALLEHAALVEEVEGNVFKQNQDHVTNEDT
ncbi:tetratricopeptide repeat protein [Alkalicoccobacillus porphyridii]|uniref:Tetratricopeptide repeat protein n=1 Tax=Alkalicoccobacillus porphyridii TaxID=2597270 RepID=A0A553ZXT7_9BACI|nr:tetratricopeptide repeat protein [Alkalicoccobacillus porphyridii]TSB46268.1 tetratricopeptide repeat protein [Alkalicoccobacillus porphyridii]